MIAHPYGTAPTQVFSRKKGWDRDGSVTQMSTQPTGQSEPEAASQSGGAGSAGPQPTSQSGGAISAETDVPSGQDRARSAETIRIVLADDHAVVRSGLRLLLDAEHDFEVVAEAGDLENAQRYVRGHRPAVLVLDLNMPGGSSLEAIPRIREDSPDTQIVMLTMQQEPAFARHALSAGAIGYVLKEAADDELVEAVRRAARG